MTFYFKEVSAQRPLEDRAALPCWNKAQKVPLTLMMLSGARFMLRFLILTVSWWAVLVGRRYLLIKGLGNSVPSKCFSPKANKLDRETQRGGDKKPLKELLGCGAVLPKYCTSEILLNKQMPFPHILYNNWSTYLSSALVKMILSWWEFALKEQIGSSSGYIKTFLVAKIQATCFGKHKTSFAVKRINR